MKRIKQLVFAFLATLSLNGLAHHRHDLENDETIIVQETSGMNQIYDSYFAVKDAFVKGNAIAASEKASALNQQLEALDAKQLKAEEAEVWAKTSQTLKKESTFIASTKDIKKQRESFARLSTAMYGLMKAAHPATEIYYQKCPMFNDGKGGTWLSREKTIKNPFYGSAMLSCGSTTETLN